jgi:uncharacterized membrane protein YbhN (UPF0104 family)
MRAIGLLIVGLAVSAVSLWVVARSTDLAAAWAIVGRVDGRVLAACLAVLAVQAVVRTMRWRLVLPPRDGELEATIALGRVLQVNLIGYLGNTVLPARLGEALRSLLIARREALPVAETFGASLLERLVDTTVLAAAGLVAAVTLGAGSLVPVALLAGLVAVATMMFLRAGARLPSRFVGGGRPQVKVAAGLVRRIARGADPRVPSHLVLVAALSAVAWGLDAAAYWLVGASLGIALPPMGAVLVSGVVVLSTVIPAAPGYLGTFEVAALAALAALGLSGETALAFALVAHVVAVLPLCVAGAIALAWVAPAVRAVPLPLSRPAR